MGFPSDFCILRRKQIGRKTTPKAITGTWLLKMIFDIICIFVILYEFFMVKSVQWDCNLARKKKTVVVLIHGIRTRAAWQSDLENILTERKKSHVEVETIGFEYFDLLRFWFPFITRNKPIQSIEKQLNQINTNFSKTHNISIIAHSFGTYAVTKIIENNPHLEIENLILCGSVVPENFDWARVQNQITSNIVNDCGSNDVLPALANATSWGYGATGTYGMKKFQVTDRLHPIAHSEYFEKKFVDTYWKPLLWENILVESPNSSKETRSPIWFWLTEFPVKWPIVIALFFMLDYFAPQIQDNLAVGSFETLVTHSAVIAKHGNVMPRPGCNRPSGNSIKNTCAITQNLIKPADGGDGKLLARSGPSTSCSPVNLHDLTIGDIVKVKDTVGKWQYVERVFPKSSPKLEGWSHSDHLGKATCP